MHALAEATKSNSVAPGYETRSRHVDHHIGAAAFDKIDESINRPIAPFSRYGEE